MLVLEKTCEVCHTTYKIRVVESDYKLWQAGRMLIQDALPELTDDERELLLSGVCGTCFDRIFKHIKLIEGDI